MGRDVMGAGMDEELAPLFAPGTALQGEQGARYELGAQLGRGGFGEVYEAWRVEVARDGQERGERVAVKFLTMGVDRRSERRFLQEAQSVLRLNHQNIVQGLDLGRLDGCPFLVMEFLGGRDLDEVLAARLRAGEGGLGAQRAVGLLVPVCDALVRAHALGIVHKDLKPSNLRLVDEGTPQERLVVLDFGVARILEAPAPQEGETARAPLKPQALTTAGLFCTYEYAPPEYLRAQEALPEGDIYQLGLILIEMLTALPALPVSDALPPLMRVLTCTRMHMERAWKIPAPWDEDETLGPILARATALDPHDRYSAQGLRDALAAALPALDPRHKRFASLARDAQPRHLGELDTLAGELGLWSSYAHALDGLLQSGRLARRAETRAVERRLAQVSLEQLGDPGKALALWSASLEEAPSDEPLQDEVGRCLKALLEQGREEEVVSWLEAHQGQASLGPFLLQVVRASTGWRREEVRPRALTVQLHLQSVFAPEDAAATAAKLVALLPDHLPALEILADHFEQKGRLREALLALSRLERLMDDPARRLVLRDRMGALTRRLSGQMPTVDAWSLSGKATWGRSLRSALDECTEDGWLRLLKTLAQCPDPALLDWTCQRLQVDQPRWRRAVRSLPGPWLGGHLDDGDEPAQGGDEAAERAPFPRGAAGRRLMEALGWSQAPPWQEVPFALLPAGRFQMGSPNDEPDRDADEAQREVEVARPFLVMRVPVTQGLWSKFSKHHRARFVEAGVEAPAERVTWYEAAQFANAMSAQEGLPLAYEKRGRAEHEALEGAAGGFRLPTELEWEYACRAGASGPRYGEPLEDLAWFGLAPPKGRRPAPPPGREPGTRPVGLKRPNAWGLCDTLGNVWEWCQDAREAGERVVRGGAWSSEPRFVRAAQRGWAAPDAREDDIGFRLVRPLL